MRLLQWAGWAALAGILWLSAAMLYYATRPMLGPATLLAPGETPRTYDYPFRWRQAPNTRFLLRQEIWLPAHHPTVFVFYPQDILWGIAVNGHRVQGPGLPISVLSCEGRSINLAPFLHSGVNALDLQMGVSWGDARLRLAVSPRDPYALTALALSLAAIGASAAFVAEIFRVKLFRAEWLVIFGGIGLRAIYLWATPYYVRSLDYWGHTDYLDYVVQHFSVPPPGANWEWFQPPLYYFLVGGITRLILALGMAEDQRYVLWQAISFLFSVGVLIAGWGLARVLYRENTTRRIYILAALSVAPPLVFNAARVSNDGLAALLAFVWLFFLVRFTHRPDKISWFGLSFALGLALLAKATALALVAVSVFFLLLKRRISLPSRLAFLTALGAVCGAISGGYYLPRLLHAHAIGTSLVGNLDSLDPRGHIQDVFEKSLVFNPLKLIRHPLDETWGPRNDHFLEVLFKALLLGQGIDGQSYKILARFMVVTALLLVPAFLVGIYRAFGRRAFGAEPLLLTFAGVFAAQWLFLQIAPYVSTEDFRFSVIIIVPLVFYLLEGVEFFPVRVRSTLTFLLQLALLNSAIYLASLAMGV